MNFRPEPIEHLMRAFITLHHPISTLCNSTPSREPELLTWPMVCFNLSSKKKLIAITYGMQATAASLPTLV